MATSCPPEEQITMNNLAHLQVPAVAAPYIGAAEVVDDVTTALVLRLKDGIEVSAELALGYGYQPAIGDRVLAIGSDDGYFVIGVILAQNATKLAFAGDLTLSAVGKLRIEGMAGVQIEGPEVSVRAGRLEMVARRVSQRYDRLKQRVNELLSVQAGQTHTVVDGSQYTRAKSSTLLTEEKVSINGKSIHLG
jgi:Protein of unknown function (DUF3540)